VNIDDPRLLPPLLDALGAARRAKAWLDAEIKRVEAPHLEAAKAASARYRDALEEAERRESSANDDAREAYTAALEARRAELLAGHEAPGIPLPGGWTVQQRTTVEIVDAGAVPRALCTPSKTAVAAALKAGAVPGAELRPLIAFVRHEDGKKEPK
jgi:hypothetical protein